MTASYDRLAAAVTMILDELGYDPEENPHLAETPQRVAQAFRDLTKQDDFKFTVFDNKDIDQMVVVQDIPFYSLCAHHLLPFHGKAHVAYVPDKHLVGISKLARTVEHFSRGLNVQEELTRDVIDFLVEKLEPKGVAVVMKAHHLCMAMRGIQKPGHLTTTSALNGVFLDPEKEARTEFMALIGGNNG